MNNTRKFTSLQDHLISLHDLALQRERYHHARFLATSNEQHAALAAKHGQIRKALAERLMEVCAM